MADCKGNKGVGNTIETQEAIYNDKTEEIGIRNKMIANRKILERETEAYKHYKKNPVREVFFEN